MSILEKIACHFSGEIQMQLKSHMEYTVWKFHDFSINQILREINFWDSRSAKSAILAHFETLDFDSL